MIYSAGYSGHKLSVLKELAVQLNATIVDIRLNPFSPNPDFRRTFMTEKLGKLYVSLPEWGNVNYNEPDEPIKINKFQRGLKLFRQIQGNTIILCACKDRASCHRQVIAEMLDVEVLEVTSAQWAAAKPVKIKYVQERLF